MRFSFLSVLTCIAVPTAFVEAEEPETPADPTEGAVAWPELKPSVGTARRSPSAVLFDLPADATGTLSFPRLDTPIGKVYWLGNPKQPLRFKQTPDTWTIGIANVPAEPPRTIVLETAVPAYLPSKPWVAKGNEKNVVRLDAHHAVVHGEKLQYEPLPHKNTVGFWVNAEDWAEWRFTTEPGRYAVRILQGCGKGQGGSTARIEVGDEQIDFDVVDTGHFQNFRWRTLGTIDIGDGEHALRLRAVRKAKNAVMDCRAIELVPPAILEEHVNADAAE